MKATRTLILLLVAALTSQPLLAEDQPSRKRRSVKTAPLPYPAAKKIASVLPDLRVRRYVFLDSKNVAVQVANTGLGDAKASVLRLTIRRINGTPVGRQKAFRTPAIPAKSTAWVLMDAKSLLPKSVHIQSTVFRTDLDVTSKVAEVNESNNRTWHNL